MLLSLGLFLRKEDRQDGSGAKAAKPAQGKASRKQGCAQTRLPLSRHTDSRSWDPVWAVGEPWPGKAVRGPQGAQPPWEMKTCFAEFIVVTPDLVQSQKGLPQQLARLATRQVAQVSMLLSF